MTGVSATDIWAVGALLVNNQTLYALFEHWDGTAWTAHTGPFYGFFRAVSAREYQTDQSSLTPAPTAAGAALEKRQKQQQRQKQPHRCAGLTGSLHTIPFRWR